MKLLSQIGFIARVEARFFLQYPKMLLACAVVAALPALYALIYLSSVWDPAGHTEALPVGLVNLDQGVNYHDQRFNVGQEVVGNLRTLHQFGFVDYNDEAVARSLVRQGKLAFALIIPNDFSSQAVPGNSPGEGKLVIYTSEGNNFESAVIAREFAKELGHFVNESLNEQRWSLVLNNAAGSQRSVQLLHEGVAELRAGAKTLTQGSRQASVAARDLSNGSAQLYKGVDTLTDGVKQLSAGLRTLDSKRPRVRDLTLLKNGAETLATKHTEFSQGLKELQDGSKHLKEGVTTFRDESRDSLFVPARIGDGLDQVLSGVTQLDSGLGAAATAQQQIQEGAATLSSGVTTLTNGVRAMNSGIHTMAIKLPEDHILDELDQGASTLAVGAKALAQGNLQLHDGMLKLSGGLDLLANSLPAAPKLEGSARGLANSVQPHIEVEAPVANSGSGFAPNVIPAALWLGAGIAAFLIHVKVLPRHAQMFAKPSQLLGKMVMPASVVLLQAALVLGTVLWILQIHIVHKLPFATCLAVSSLTFLCIVFALSRLLGDAGKALAMLFLAVQLSSSGGVIPVELSGNIFAGLSPWLPLTWVVRAMKAAMFDAYEGAWLQPLLLVALAGFVAGLCACWLGNWRYVKTSSMRPAIDI